MVNIIQKPLLLIDGDTDFSAFIRTQLSGMLNSGLTLRWENRFDPNIMTPSVIGTFDLIFVGKEAGGRKGMDIVADIRADNPVIPIVFLSNEKDFETIQQAIRLNVDDVLLKKEMNGTFFIDHIHRMMQRVKLRDNLTEVSRKILLEQKKKEAIEELIVTVCHEFNNPLAAIKISTDILSRQEQSPEVNSALEQLSRNVSLVETLVNRMRDKKNLD